MTSRRTVLRTVTLAGTVGTAGCLFGTTRPGYSYADLAVDNDDDERHVVHLRVTRGRIPTVESWETPTDPNVEEYEDAQPFVPGQDEPRPFDVEVRAGRRRVLEGVFEEHEAYHVEGWLDGGNWTEHAVHDYGGRLAVTVHSDYDLSFGRSYD